MEGVEAAAAEGEEEEAVQEPPKANMAAVEAPEVEVEAEPEPGAVRMSEETRPSRASD